MSLSSVAQALWRTVQGELRKILPASEYTNWFEHMTCRAEEGDCLILVAPNDFAELWVNKNFQDLLTRHITLAAGRKMGYRLVAPDSVKSADAPQASAVVEKPVATPIATARNPVIASMPPAIKSSNTFENFIVGPENEMAHGASLAVANDPGHVYNPLFIYGATGLGKTHIMHAIAHSVIRRNPQARIVYVSSEAFTNDYILALQEGTISNFRRRYREIDVLLIDDIHFLAGKESTQDEFFHTFNELHNCHKQIVLTSDRPVSEIAKLQERLVSRFTWGMTADIKAPGLETRTAILRKKALVRGVQLSDEVIGFLASRIARNVRNLEGAILRLSGYAQLSSSPVTIETVERVLHDVLLEEAASQITPEVIQKKVAEYYRISGNDMTSKRRTSNIAFPRQVAMYLCTQLTGMSLVSIGDAFGGRDHGTVIHARKTVEGQMEVDQNVRRAVDYLSVQISSQRP
ncbi:MAG: chromosomal replication initiator protein DnaA [Puniceicoccales bacterium]|jgi:chromosomal replication initiator protein|nr:chromosomal replication initiator protein DnaA [Puniceicoccales bacterium]